MGFYDTKILKELNINGENQDDDDQDNDYTAGDDHENGEDGGDTPAEDPAPEEGSGEGPQEVQGTGGDEPQEVTGSEEPAEGEEVDYTQDDSDTGENTTTEDPSPEGTNDGGETDYTQDNGDDTTGGLDGESPEGEEADYTQDGGDDTGANTEEGDNGNAEEGTEDGEDGNTEDDSNDLKTAEDQIFADLSDEQKLIQSDELRNNFREMYTTVLDIIDKVNNVHKSEDSLPVFEFISTQLLTLKDIINTTITRTFDTKTYYENNVTFSQCLAILNTINKLIEETVKKINKDNKE